MPGIVRYEENGSLSVDSYEVDIVVDCPDCGGTVRFAGLAYAAKGTSTCCVVGVECDGCSRTFSLEFDVEVAEPEEPN